MDSCLEGGGLGKVGVRRRQGAGSAPITGADAAARIVSVASWPQRLRTDATARMVPSMTRGPCGEEVGRAWLGLRLRLRLRLGLGLGLGLG